MQKGWAAYESAMMYGQKVAVIGCQYVDKDTYDISLIPLYMTTRPDVCSSLSAGDEVSYNENAAAEIDTECEQMVVEARDEGM